MKVSECLEKAVEYINKGWCKGAWARNEHGEVTNATSQDAKYWCAMGSIMVASKFNLEETANYSQELVKVFNASLDYLQGALGVEQCLDRFNDALETREEDVVQVFERAIDLAKKVEASGAANDPT